MHAWGYAPLAMAISNTAFLHFNDMCNVKRAP